MPILHNLIWMIQLFILAHSVYPAENSAAPVSPDLLEVTNKINYRLPTYVLPSYYIIKLVPTNIESDERSFEGESSIKIHVSEKNMTSITLHAKHLTFDENYTTLEDMNKQSVKPLTHSINNVTEFLILVFETPITVGEHWLHLKYTGPLKFENKGFFITSYDNEEGEKVWLAATDFVKADARQAFPCFDEPAMKAQFKISIKHFDNYTAISNMPVTNKTKDNVDLQKIWTNFDVTPVMSTYLIAFIVSNLRNMSSKSEKFSCWAQKNKVQNCKYALEIGQKALEALEEYTDSKNIVPKVDNVALQSFESGGMENWGLIIYSEDHLLYEEGVTMTSTIFNAAPTMSHELAHQWFGNLVTPSWWDHLWVSEGLSQYFTYLITDKIEPNWRFLDLMVVEQLQSLAFLADAKKAQHPLITKVDSYSEIYAIDSSIVYVKGAFVIRMISHVITDGVVQDGLRKYIQENQFGTATSDDLVNALVSVAKRFSKNINLKKFMHSWTDQAGYPVIHVNRLLSAPGYVSINQTRFLSSDTRNVTSTELWWIPVNFATRSNSNFIDTRPSHWLKPNRFAQKVPLKLNADDWFIVNKQQTGYYRVNYDKQNWILIADYLNTPEYNKIHVLNRAQLLDDSFNLAQSEYLGDYGVFLHISSYLAQEDDCVPWYPALRAFDLLDVALQNTETHKLFKSYVLKLIEKVENKVGYTEMSGDDYVTKLYRASFIKWACKMGSGKCADATREILIEYVSGSKKISNDLLEVSVCAGIRNTNASIWNKTFDLYLKPINKRISAQLLNALGCSLNSNIINSYLAKIFNTRDRDMMFDVLKSVTEGNKAGIDIILNFIEENFETKKNTTNLGVWLEEFEYVLNGAKRRPTNAQMKKLNILWDKTASMSSQNRSLEIYNEINDSITSNAEWLRKYEPQIRSFLISQMRMVECRVIETSTCINFHHLLSSMRTHFGIDSSTVMYPIPRYKYLVMPRCVKLPSCFCPVTFHNYRYTNIRFTLAIWRNLRREKLTSIPSLDM